MPVESVETLIVGGGQAGLALSAHLSRRGLPHLILERARVVERWRSERWDSLVANGPAWHDRFPDQAFEGLDPDAFAPRDAIVRYFETFAARIAAPVRTGTPATRATRAPGGFRVETPAGVIEARRLVAATGPFQRPLVPAMLPGGEGLHQLHSARYRNPAGLPPGGVLVVGAGSSGVQIAEELAQAGRRVHLSVGPHDRPPRRYRGRDFVWWLGALGQWDATTRGPGTEHVTIAVSGAQGGRTVDFRRLAAERGVVLHGRATGFAEGRMRFAPDLAQTLARGDASHLSVLDEADAHVRRMGLDLPEEPEARAIPPDPPCVSDPVLSLDLKREGIGTVLWATGYALDFGWLQIPEAFDDRGRPDHRRGVAARVPGLSFLGLPWLSRRASAFIWGAWTDAAYLADHIATERALGRAPA